MNCLNHIRKPEEKNPIFKAIFYTALLFCLGLIIGTVAKLFDIYTTNLGNIFSQISVWFFICTLISVYSGTAKRAAVNVLCFCFGMLFAYYITAEITSCVYSYIFIYGWTIFALFSPIMGFCVWYAKGKHWISTIISIGVLVTMLVATIVLFDKLRISDILFTLFTGFILFKK